MIYSGLRIYKSLWGAVRNRPNADEPVDRKGNDADKNKNKNPDDPLGAFCIFVIDHMDYKINQGAHCEDEKQEARRNQGAHMLHHVGIDRFRIGLVRENYGHNADNEIKINRHSGQW